MLEKYKNVEDITFIVDEAMNGVLGIKMFEENLVKECQLNCCKGFYRLCLMDIAMPEKDGI